MIFAEAVFTFEEADGKLKGALDWQSGGLDLQGTIQPANAGEPISVAIVGTGRQNTDTEGWEYDYRASLAYQWPTALIKSPPSSAR